jgi:hypothetical protein
MVVDAIKLQSSACTNLGQTGDIVSCLGHPAADEIEKFNLGMLKIRILIMISLNTGNRDCFISWLRISRVRPSWRIISEKLAINAEYLYFYAKFLYNALSRLLNELVTSFPADAPWRPI